MTLENLFEKAKLREELRPLFLKNIDLGEYSKYVKKIEYRCEENNKLMTCKNFLGGLLGITNTKSKILVYNSSFEFSEYIENIHDFSGVLKFHEGQHAKDYYEGIFNCRPSSLNEIESIKFYVWIELRATKNQFNNIIKNNSEKYINRVRAQIENYQNILKN